jgi:hypothetical protein
MNVAFKIVSQAYNSWKVQTSFPKQVDSATLAHRLHEVKTALARQFNMPDGLIEYDRLLKREITDEGTVVLIQFLRKSIQSGTPRFRCLPLKLEDGTVLPDMILEADIYPLDEYDQPTSFELIKSRLSSEGIDSALVDWPTITSALSQMQEDFDPALGLVIGRGTVPDFGLPCKIKYGESKLTTPALPSAWLGSYPVRKGELLTELASAIPGRRTGRNLMGRELMPRVGIETKVDVGDGAVMSRGGTAVVAARDGIVIFERTGRDKRDADARDRTPAKLAISVRPMILFNESDQYNLDLADAVVIQGDVLPGSNIRSRNALCIEGNVGECSNIECKGTLRIVGNVSCSAVSSEQHISIIGHVKDSRVEAGGTAQLEGTVEDCFVHARDVVAHDVTGGTVEALNQTDIQVIRDSAKSAASVSINLRKAMEQQQVSNKETIEELRDSMAHITQIFGSEIALQVEAGSIQPLLLQWLRRQKSTFGTSYTQAEVQDFRQILESVPQLRAQLAVLGNELREVTRKLHDTPGTSASAVNGGQSSGSA